MSKAKWSVVRKASTGKITANSVIQIVLPEIPSRYKKMLYYFHQTPLSSLTVEGVWVYVLWFPHFNIFHLPNKVLPNQTAVVISYYATVPGYYLSARLPETQCCSNVQEN